MATKNVKNSKKVSRFTVDFPHRKIVGTQTSFDLAGKGEGPVYEELMRLMDKHPTFDCKIKVLEKNSDKETYKGFTVEFIQYYFSARDELDDTNNREDLDLELAFAKSQGESRLCAARELLRKLYDSEEKPFDYGKAQKVVRAYKKKHFMEKEDDSGSENEPEENEEDIDELPHAVNE